MGNNTLKKNWVKSPSLDERCPECGHIDYMYVKEGSVKRKCPNCGYIFF